ncbi:hypothetical protein FHG87_010081 [Trinorchestia longiramus]|nr:hypothetical protein FHG87_010081 [Trinorchestia longiramus]
MELLPLHLFMRLTCIHAAHSLAPARCCSSKSSATSKKQNNQMDKLRAEFECLEADLQSQLDREQLSDEEWDIHCAHAEAIKKRQFTYDDPVTLNRVMTRLCHFLRGKCCGNACRHCVYNHENVAESVRRHRKFNSSFWVDGETEAAQAYRTTVCSWTALSVLHASCDVHDDLLFKH